MFERQVLGEDYWKKQAATQPALYPSGAPLSDALVRGEVSIAPLLYNVVYTKKKRRRAGRDLLPARRRAAELSTAPASPRPPPIPTPRKLFLNWCLSEEGQTFMIKELGYLTALKKPPLYPPGFDPKVVKTWVPNFEQYEKLRAGWIEEWNKTYGYRQ